MKKISCSLMLCTLVIGSVMVSCNDSEPLNRFEDRPVYETLDKNAKKLIGENSQVFAFNILRNAYAETEGKENLCLSPYSAFMSLCAFANGDQGDSRVTILNEMEFNGMFDTSLLNEYIDETNRVIVFGPEMTNFSASCQHLSSLWYDFEDGVNSEFSNNLKKYYSAEFVSQSPKGVNGASSINKWVKANSALRLDDFMECEIDEDLAFVNLMLFHGTWTFPFSKKYTCPMSFRNYDGTESSVQAMRLDRPVKYFYGSNEECKVIALPFSSSKSVNLYLLIPGSNLDFGSFVKNLSAEKFLKLKDMAQPCKVDLRLPPFSVSSRFNLLSLIPTAGNTITLNNIVSDGNVISIKNVPHMAQFEVGLTETYCNPTLPQSVDYSISGDDVVGLSVDSPFVYILEHEETGALILMGCVTGM